MRNMWDRPPTETTDVRTLPVHKVPSPGLRVPLLPRAYQKINPTMRELLFWFEPEWDYFIIKRSDSCTLANWLFHFNCRTPNPWFKRLLHGTSIELYNPVVVDGIRYKGSGRYFFLNEAAAEWD